MNGDKVQLSKKELEIADFENRSSNLSDDDLAASLGFITTLTEGAIPQPQVEEGEAPEEEDPPGEDAAEDTKDADQDEDIQRLEADIARLEAMMGVQTPVNGPEDTTTGTEA